MMAVFSGKFERLVGFLEMISVHKTGSLFESLLESQVRVAVFHALFIALLLYTQLYCGLELRVPVWTSCAWMYFVLCVGVFLFSAVWATMAQKMARAQLGGTSPTRKN